MMSTTTTEFSAQSLINKSDRSNQAQAQLKPNHFKDLVEGRGLDARWIEANCRSLTAQEATQRLGYPAKGAGILLEGVGIQIQFKPDRPWKNEGEKRAPKYRSPLGDYDAMLPIHPDDKAYCQVLPSRGASLSNNH
jgi:putative DNA primase/helicase